MEFNIQEQNKGIRPRGVLKGSIEQQQWKILHWHEKRLKQLTEILVKQENDIKGMAKELVELKNNSNSNRKTTTQVL